jgi:hypothetical protein
VCVCESEREREREREVGRERGRDLIISDISIATEHLDCRISHVCRKRRV